MIKNKTIGKIACFLNEDGVKQVNMTATQPDTDFTYVELNDVKEYDGSLLISGISAGN